MKTSILIMLLVVVMFFISGCRDTDTVKVELYEQYGIDNVRCLDEHNIFIIRDGTVFIIREYYNHGFGSLNNWHEFDISDFVNDKEYLNRFEIPKFPK